MGRIKIEDLPKDHTINMEEMRKVIGGTIGDMERILNSVGDDAQLAQIDLQNWTQKIQRPLTMMSNISKAQHDVLMATIRNLK